MLGILGSLLGSLGTGAAATAAAPTLGATITKAAVPAVTGAIVQKAFSNQQTPRTISPRTSGRSGLQMSSLSPASLAQLQSQYGRRFYG